MRGLVDEQAASRVGALIGLGGSLAPEEVSWALRRFVAGLAADRPLVLTIEDLHWAEPTLLDLLAGLSELEAPILLLATARPDSPPDATGLAGRGTPPAARRERDRESPARARHRAHRRVGSSRRR